MEKNNPIKDKPWPADRTNFDRNLAVVIGIDRYENPNIHDLSTPVSDANALANLLENGYGYKPENVLRLVDGQAKLSGLRTLLTDTLPKLNLTEGDRLIFYFAGHGLPKNSEEGPTGYLVPQDAQPNREDSFLPMNEVYDALSQLPCHHLLVILDGCFAGTFRWAGSRKLIAELETIHREPYDRFIRFPAWQVITSSAHDQEALDFVKLSQDPRGKVDDKSHSPFALALLEALQDRDPDSQGRRYSYADYTKDGVIVAHELIVYLSDRVSQLSQERQAPGLYPLKREYDKGEFIFVRPDFDPQQLLPAPELNEENNPYRGLKPFEERHAQFFFGRQKLVEELSDRLAQSRRPLTVVLGISGSGKSSLVKAGLLPHLRQKPEKEESAQHWYILAPLRPGKSPFVELAKAVLPVAHSHLIDRLAQVSFLDTTMAAILDPKSPQKPKADSREQISGEKAFEATKLAQLWHTATREAKLLLIVDYFQQLQGFCHQPQERAELSQVHEEINNTLKPLARTLEQNPKSCGEAIAQWSHEHPHTKILLVIDQLEELITMSQEDRESEKQSDSQEQKEWQRFLSLLRVTLAKYRQQLHVIVTLRSDFEPRFLNSALKAHWKSGRFSVRGMNSDELRDAIEGPALKQALYFEPPELVGKLIDEVGQMPGALPLLSFTLSELYIKLYERWTKDKSIDRALRIKDYEELGGVAGALTRRATQEYDNLVRDFGEASGKTYQGTMRRVMLRMVAIEGGGVARRQVPDSELVYSNDAENEKVKMVVERLVNARLVVKGQGTEEPYVEPAHDELLQGWTKFREWIDRESKINILLQRDLTQSARRWYAKEKSPWYLWTHDPRLFQAMRLLRLEDKEIIWFNKLERDFLEQSIQSYDDLETQLDKERKLRLISEVRQKVIEAEFLLSQGSEKALPKAIEAFGLNRNQFQDSIILGEVQTVLRKLSEKQDKTHSFFTRFHHEQAVTSLSFCPSGKSLATACKDYKIRIWDTVNHTVDKTLEGHREEIIFLTFDPTGKYLVSSGKDGVFLWDIQLEAPLDMDTGTLDCIESLSFNNDGNLVVGGGSEGFIYIWNISKVRNHSANLEDYQHIHLNYHPAHIAKITSIAFSHDSKYIATGSQDQLIKLWQLNFEGELIKLLDIVIKPIVPFFQSDYVSIIESNTFPSGGTEEFSGKEKPSLYCLSELVDRPFIVELSSNQYDEVGARKVIGITLKGNKYVPVIDIHGKVKGNPFFGDDPEVLSHFEPITSLAFSPDDRLIASASLDGMIRLWSIDGIPLGKPFQNDNVPINALAFSPNGQNIVSGDHNGDVKIWSLDGYIIGSPYKPFYDPIKSLVFSPNGKDIATASARYGTVKLHQGGLYFWLSSCCDLLLGNAKFPQIYDDQKACVICEKEKARQQLNSQNIKGAEKTAQSIRFYENLNRFNLGVDLYKYVQMEIALLLYNQATLLAEQGQSEDAKAKLNEVMKIMPLEMFVSYGGEEIAHYKTNTRLLSFEPEDIEHIFCTDKLIDYIESNPFPLGLNRNISTELASTPNNDENDPDPIG